MHYQYRGQLRPILDGDGVGNITLKANFGYDEVIFWVPATLLYRDQTLFKYKIDIHNPSMGSVDHRKHDVYYILHCLPRSSLKQ